ncbi:GAF domain-containing protein [Clostridium acetobutylicum]|uniref:GAF domain-containing protein n=1 Tax=Clostridium acetobutylicum (strain ATCC 824 / DSM 792 / JCM 1419 / IAM 19013 / LMG 5710 / NBRC 13948 / NRRL B-527 / VKM B-1787 / 2291 / W) TaxID=272562 RepID=Q97HA3_CLOAB|nr:MULTISPECIES: GAF domain-containing protein [Clostridium]AAK80068.1 GAF domain-containing protein [Clostridium acetobutylicum ATCC 824]ADZ21160.1 GAF domain-containing protein [Clostridium acetobutylicum EA 2018]AEI32188.1 GAF domain-containing protein [Clostridium acetobutylicum DSM 1731]AWV79505.1 GAF domain-containing protein [Clostridium acetobutylicum]MBC2394522.1 GAF domain-containing protein [Clostridium acetobutylicum]
MFDISVFKDMSTEDKYENMVIMLKGLIEGEENSITKLSNASALMNALIGRINWCGFYIANRDKLILGPFQGMPACTEIKIGEGVCGTAFKDKKVMRIENVHDFKGHIACDAASNSEIVLPIIVEGKVKAVLDIDSEEIGRFTELEEKYLIKCAKLLQENINWNIEL